MNVVERHDKSLPHLVVQPDGYDPGRPYPVIILLHGFGAHMGDLASLAPVIHQTGYLYVCPNAPLAFQLGPGMVGYGWTAPYGQATPQEVENAEKLVTAFINEVMEEYGVEPGNLLLGGFSQGGGMAYRCGLGRPDIFAGLVALSSVFPAEELTERLSAERKQPVFIAHGTEDPLLPVQEARRARRFLEEAGFQPLYREYAMGHEINKQVLDDLVPWLHEVLPPLR